MGSQDDVTRPEPAPGPLPPTSPPRRRRFRKRGFLFILVVAVGLAGLGLRFHFDAFKERPLALPPTAGPDQPFLFEIPLGMSLRTLAQELTALGVLDQPYYFLALAYLSGDAGRVKAGEYEISPGMTPVALLDRLGKNQVYQRAVTLIEGWTLAQLLATRAREKR